MSSFNENSAFGLIKHTCVELLAYPCMTYMYHVSYVNWQVPSWYCLWFDLATFDDVFQYCCVDVVLCIKTVNTCITNSTDYIWCIDKRIGRLIDCWLGCCYILLDNSHEYGDMSTPVVLTVLSEGLVAFTSCAKLMVIELKI